MHSSASSSLLFDAGFERYDLAASLGIRSTDQRFAALVAEFENLPADRYGSATGRHRRYAQGVLLPWTGDFHWMPDSADSAGPAASRYFQGENNPDFPGVVRAIPSITAPARHNPLLLDIVRFDFAQTYWDPLDARWPLHVGVHFIRLSIDGDGQAVSSPDELHQDGEPFTFAHLMYRRNAQGGGNVIAEPKCRGMQPADVPVDLILAEFELTAPLDSYGIADDKVSHYVAPIRKGPDSVPGERAMILVDFTVLTQRI